MTLRDVGSARDVARRRDRLLEEAEGQIAQAAARAVRGFLRSAAAQVTPDALTAAAEDFPHSVRLFTLGEAVGWWEQELDAHVTAAVRQVWADGYQGTRDGQMVRSSLTAAEDHLANVVDRLSRTATPTLPEHAFDRVRIALADEVARGTSMTDVSRRMAAELAWDEPATYWRGRLDTINGQIDAILDPIGPPGHPAREAARLNDSAVRALQDQRAEAVRHVDRVESTWQTRATRIARTETVGAYNAGSLDAAQLEGAGVKRWVATADDRTRDDHLDADGECVPTDDPFTVGGEAMLMPGDPSAPPEQTVNCRCTMVYARSCDEAADVYDSVDEVMDAERERRAEEAEAKAARDAPA